MQDRKHGSKRLLPCVGMPRFGHSHHLPLRIIEGGQRLWHEGTILLTDQEAEAVTEDSTDNDIIEQVQECLAEVLPQTESAQEHLSEEMEEPSVENFDSAEQLYEMVKRLKQG